MGKLTQDEFKASLLGQYSGISRDEHVHRYDVVVESEYSYTGKDLNYMGQYDVQRATKVMCSICLEVKEL